jgi:hypothetical protein
MCWPPIEPFLASKSAASHSNLIDGLVALAHRSQSHVLSMKPRFSLVIARRPMTSMSTSNITLLPSEGERAYTRTVNKACFRCSSRRQRCDSKPYCGRCEQHPRVRPGDCWYPLHGQGPPKRKPRDGPHRWTVPPLTSSCRPWMTSSLCSIRWVRNRRRQTPCSHSRSHRHTRLRGGTGTGRTSQPHRALGVGPQQLSQMVKFSQPIHSRLHTSIRSSSLTATGGGPVPRATPFPPPKGSPPSS